MIGKFVEREGRILGTCVIATDTWLLYSVVCKEDSRLVVDASTSSLLRQLVVSE